jgi:hypothetical protein
MKCCGRPECDHEPARTAILPDKARSFYIADAGVTVTKRPTEIRLCPRQKAGGLPGFGRCEAGNLVKPAMALVVTRPDELN